MKKVTIECRHVNLKKYKDRSLYIYDIGDNQDIVLCPDCHMLLAGEIMKQLATEVFIDTFGYWDHKAMVLEDLNIKEGKNARKKRRGSKERRKKGKD